MLDPKKWREIPGWRHHYEYIGPIREPNRENVKQMIRDAIKPKGQSVAARTLQNKVGQECDATISDTRTR